MSSRRCKRASSLRMYAACSATRLVWVSLITLSSGLQRVVRSRSVAAKFCDGLVVETAPFAQDVVGVLPQHRRGPKLGEAGHAELERQALIEMRAGFGMGDLLEEAGRAQMIVECYVAAVTDGRG